MSGQPAKLRLASPAKGAADPLRAARILNGLPLGKLDPYLVWALLTDFRGFGRPRGAGQRRIPFLVELEQAGQAQALAKVNRKDGDTALVRIAPSYVKDTKTRYCTLSVLAEDLGEFFGQALVVRADMGLAGVEVPLPDAAPVAPLTSPVNIDGRIGPFDAWQSRTPLVGVIDHGIALLNRQFRIDCVDRETHGSLTLRRIVRFWDQFAGPGAGSAPRPPPWQPEAAFGYGAVLAAEPGPGGYEYPGVDRRQAESETYRAWSYQPVFGAAAHGTHVLDIAAGGPNPLHRLGRPPKHDAATRLPIVAVQLPWLPAKDVSGASLCVQLLDALRFIVESAGPDRPVVVNLSDGAMAGSHNGGSVLEQALDEYLSQRPNLSLIVAAGNAFDSNTHVSGQLRADGRADLRWKVLPDDVTESFLEIWVDERAAMRVELVPPGHAEAVFALDLNQQPEVWQQPSARGGPMQVVAAGMMFEQVASGKGQLALLALRPTRNADPAVTNAVAPHGVWTVRLHNPGPDTVRFNAWVERDDPPFGDFSPSRQSTLSVPAKDAKAAKLDSANTMNSLATGKRCIVVAGYRVSDRRMAEYSSAGSTEEGRRLPTLAAPCEQSLASPGLLAAGNASGSVMLMNGTSVAAPVVTRAIANALCRSAAAKRVPNDTSRVEAALSRAVQPPPDEPAPDQQPTVQRVGIGFIDADAEIILY